MVWRLYSCSKRVYKSYYRCSWWFWRSQIAVEYGSILQRQSHHQTDQKSVTMVFWYQRQVMQTWSHISMILWYQSFSYTTSTNTVFVWSDTKSQWTDTNQDSRWYPESYRTNRTKQKFIILSHILMSSKNSKPLKANLPTKICLTCNRPFTRRKKRERCRDEVKFCSEQCKKIWKKK